MIPTMVSPMIPSDSLPLVSPEGIGCRATKCSISFGQSVKNPTTLGRHRDDAEDCRPRDVSTNAAEEDHVAWIAAGPPVFCPSVCHERFVASRSAILTFHR
jgi:hypothetical protein